MNRTSRPWQHQRLIKDIDPKNISFALSRRIRSMMAASILQARGFRNFTEIEGGFNAITKLQFLKRTLYKAKCCN
jgi:rhodanese-related sulfurtransferase